MNRTVKQATVKQAAEQWNVKERTVRDWVYLRKITFVKVGGCVRIPQSEIDRVIAEGTIPAKK
jgi:excisionase family DNA binding protein